MKHALVLVMRTTVVASFAFLGFGLGGGLATLFPEPVGDVICVVVTLGFAACGLVIAKGGSIAKEARE